MYILDNLHFPIALHFLSNFNVFSIDFHDSCTNVPSAGTHFIYTHFLIHILYIKTTDSEKLSDLLREDS